MVNAIDQRMESAFVTKELVQLSICKEQNRHLFPETPLAYLRSSCRNELHGAVHHTDDAQLCSIRQLSPSVGPETLSSPSSSGGNTVVWPFFVIVLSSCLSSVVIQEIKSII